MMIASFLDITFSRTEAIKELDVIYDSHDVQVESYLIS